MVIFVDTSAFYALTVKNDNNHQQAQACMESAMSDADELVTHNLVVVEAAALLRARHGHAISRSFLEYSRGVVQVIMIDLDFHEQVIDRYAQHKTISVSLVDFFSFALMRRENIEYALAFDRHFEQAGFKLYRA
jgi:uncharacterized protein